MEKDEMYEKKYKDIPTFCRQKAAMRTKEAFTLLYYSQIYFL